MNDDLKSALLAFALVLAIVAPMAMLKHTIDRDGCARDAKLMGLEHVYSASGRCMVKSEQGKWIPLRNYRLERQTP